MGGRAPSCPAAPTSSPLRRTARREIFIEVMTSVRRLEASRKGSKWRMPSGDSRSEFSRAHTRHPTPYTLHPTPYTFHPTPCTFHSTPYTLHPTTHTLNHVP